MEAAGALERPGLPPRADILLDARGRWLHEGVEITHPRILDALQGSLRREESGSFSVQIGWQKALVIVEDCPRFIRAVSFPAGEDPILVLSDGTDETLDAHTLTLEGDDALICRVNGGVERARFLPSAMHQIGEKLEEREGSPFLLVGGREYPVRRPDPDAVGEHRDRLGGERDGR